MAQSPGRMGSCRAIHCVSGTILLIDLERSRYRFAYTWGVSPQWVKRYLDYSADLTEFYRNVFHRRICPDGEPLVRKPGNLLFSIRV
jgi:hypothetical protein